MDGKNYILNNPNFDKIRLRLEEDGSSNDYPRDTGHNDIYYDTGNKCRDHDSWILQMDDDASVVIPTLLTFNGEYNSVVI